MNEDYRASHDDAWDSYYFNLINELADRNSARYQEQTAQLIKSKTLELSINGTLIKFKLTPTGCSYSTVTDKSSYKHSAWVRMGWGKTAKRKSLPNFFAQAEASVLIDLNR